MLRPKWSRPDIGTRVHAERRRARHVAMRPLVREWAAMRLELGERVVAALVMELTNEAVRLERLLEALAE